MKKQAFHFEIHDLLTQFVTAFDDVVIKRYDINSKTAAESVAVRYVYSPKQRVLFDLVNKAQNITVPVIAVSIGGYSRDQSRVFNKIDGITRARSVSDSTIADKSVHFRMPVPVDVSINMSIIAKFQTDMDQIISNWVPYSNPYIVISWKVPNEPNTGFGLAINEEIRSIVDWSGQISMQYPTDINAQQRYQVTADTNFTVKGWLFPANESYAKNILKIDANFYNSRNITIYESLTGDSFFYSTSSALVNETETVTVSTNPAITNIY